MDMQVTQRLKSALTAPERQASAQGHGLLDLLQAWWDSPEHRPDLLWLSRNLDGEVIDQLRQLVYAETDDIGAGASSLIGDQLLFVVIGMLRSAHSSQLVWQAASASVATLLTRLPASVRPAVTA